MGRDEGVREGRGSEVRERKKEEREGEGSGGERIGTERIGGEWEGVQGRGGGGCAMSNKPRSPHAGLPGARRLE